MRRGETRNATLATLCDHFGISNVGAHRAMRDIERTVQLYRCLRATLPLDRVTVAAGATS